MTTSLELLLTTATIAVVSAVLSLAIGVPFGSWLRSLEPRAAHLIGTIALIPFLMPPLLVGLAVFGIVGELEVDSISGMFLVILVHGFMNFGFIAKVYAGSTIDSEQIEAARLDGATDAQIRKAIEIPQQRPGLASAGLLVVLYSATSFGLVLTLGAGKVKTLETEIAVATLQHLKLEQATQYAVLQTLLTIALYLAAKMIHGTPTALDQIHKSLLRPSWIERIFAPALLVAVALALLMVLSKAFSGEGLMANLANLATRGERAMLNITVLQASANSLRNALVVTVLTIPIAYLLASRKKAMGLVLLPIGISPVVIGLGTLALSGYLPRELTSSWLLLPLVQVVFALPVAYQILRPAYLGIDRSLIESARLDGVGRWQQVTLVELPLIKRSLALAIAFAAMVSIGEFGAASFLAFGSNETLPIVIYKLLGRPGEENFGMAMTVASIYILISAYVIWLSLKPSRTLRQSSEVAQ